MATVNVPGIGPVKDVYVWSGGALIVGIVAYAWWKKSSAPPEDFIGADPDDYATADYDSPLGSTGGNSTGNYTSVDPSAIDTNAEWTTTAVERLTSYGWDSSAVAIALGRYLSRERLTETQIEIVQAALGAVGPPPQGGPFPILESLPSTPGTGDPDPDPGAADLPPPQLYSRSPGVWKDAIEINFAHVTGAKEYEVQDVPGTGTWSQRTTQDGFMRYGLVHNGSYWLRARSINAAGEPGPWGGQVLFKTRN